MNATVGIASLTSAAAVAAPAIAADADAHDPIYAAIERHKAIYSSMVQLWAEIDEAEGNAVKAIGRRPIPLIGWRTYSAIGGSEINRARREFLAAGIDPAVIESEFLDAKQRYARMVRAERNWNKRAGLYHLLRRRAELHRAEEESGIALAATTPSTPVGAAAMIEYAVADMESGDGPEWPLETIKMACKALRTMGRA